MFAVKSIAIVALAQLIAAAPTAYPAFVVNDLNAFQPSCRSDLGTIDDLSEVSFKVTDPSDSASTSCKANWACNQSDAYPSEYVACEDPSFTFKLTKYESISDFTIDVTHTSDPLTKWAEGAMVERGNVRCSHASSGFTQCFQEEGLEAFTLAVYQAIA